MSAPERAGANRFTIRAASAADVPEMAEIDGRSNASPWGPAGFTAELGRAVSRSLVASATDGEGGSAAPAVLGFAVFWVAADEAELLNIATAPGHRRAGVGGALLREVARHAAAAGARSLRLEVRSHNAAARALYERAGFAVERVRRGYYGDDDGLVMVLQLAGDPA